MKVSASYIPPAPPMTMFVSDRARTGMTLELLLLATGRGADNAVPALRLTLDASADTILNSCCLKGSYGCKR